MSSVFPVLLLLLSVLAFGNVQSIFFGAAQSFCSVDEDCPSFGRTRCKGLSLGLCLTGGVEYFTIPGLCVRRGNIACRLRVLIERGDQAECDYYRCAQCRHQIDCSSRDQRCVNYRCRSRERGRDRLV